MDINKRLYKILSQYFKDNIELSFVEKNNVIIITKEDKVYQFDDEFNKTYTPITYTCNQSIVNSLIDKSIVEELCDKKVIDIKNGLRHNIARTRDGKVYVWGFCLGAFLGNGSRDKEVFKPKLTEYLNGLNIIDVSCGAHYTLVLTSEGDIYGWGFNGCGQTPDRNIAICHPIPYKMNELISAKFKAISCGALHSLALTEDGRVFGCGFNIFGPLVQNLSNCCQLKPIETDNILIEKISCGQRNSLLLSNEGHIYGFGEFYDVIIDLDFSKPLLNCSEKFCEIASKWNKKYFAALSTNGLFYVFYEYDLNGQKIFQLKDTNYKSFDEIFIKYSQITYRPIEGMIIEFEDSFFRNKFYEKRYEELEKLGEGSYGKVFKVYDKIIGEDFTLAIKKINFKNENENEILKELEIYALISKIKHKNIVNYYEFWIEKNLINESPTIYIQMDLCQKTLNEFIQTLNELKLDENDGLSLWRHYISSKTLIEILEGVNYLHKQNPQIIHRDLWPDNILLEMEGNNRIVLKIADFGLVTIHKYAEQLHERDVGHVRYMSPEVANGEVYDTKADIYSVGMIAKDLFNIYQFERYFSIASIKTISIIIYLLRYLSNILQY
jgi:hypothetical protein